MRSLFIPLKLATDARHLQFEAILDPTIDVVSLWFTPPRNEEADHSKGNSNCCLQGHGGGSGFHQGTYTGHPGRRWSCSWR